MKVAEQEFYKYTNSNGDRERAKWMPELFDEMIDVLVESGFEKDKYKNVKNFLTNIEYERSNDLLFDSLIRKYMKMETNSDIHDIINNVWIGLWDTTEKKNAGVNTSSFYDESHLIQVSTELEILMRKVSELYAIAMLLEFTNGDDSLLELVKEMSMIIIHDIYNDEEEIGILEYLPKIPQRIKGFYEYVFQRVFQGASAFVLFHELGHLLELDLKTANYFKVKSSKNVKESSVSLSREWNSDEISFDIMNKLFGGKDAETWMYFSGIGVAFLSLAINSKSLFKETSHPALKDRYHKSLENIKKYSRMDDYKSMLQRFDIVAEQLSFVSKWDNNKWWC